MGNKNSIKIHPEIIIKKERKFSDYVNSTKKILIIKNKIKKNKITPI